MRGATARLYGRRTRSTYMPSVPAVGAAAGRPARRAPRADPAVERLELRVMLAQPDVDVGGLGRGERAHAVGTSTPGRDEADGGRAGGAARRPARRRRPASIRHRASGRRAQTPEPRARGVDQHPVERACSHGRTAGAIRARDTLPRRGAGRCRRSGPGRAPRRRDHATRRPAAIRWPCRPGRRTGRPHGGPRPRRPARRPTATPVLHVAVGPSVTGRADVHAAQGADRRRLRRGRRRGGRRSSRGSSARSARSGHDGGPASATRRARR